MDAEAASRIERELLAHSTWIRRLARSLVSNESDAEDLIQDAWVAALREPSFEHAPARTWLARVMRNLAARRWRRREVQLEPRHSPTGADDVLDSAERLEAQRILVEEIQSLPEPARRVILLRYFDGLDGAEIARRTGEPPGTVRWRLHEALAVLREKLDRRHGGSRKRWTHALAFLAPAPAPPPPLVPASLTLSTGVLAVNSFVKLAMAAAVLVALSVSVYVATRDEIDMPDPAETAAASVEPVGETSPPKPESRLAETAPTPERASLATASTSSASTQQEADSRTLLVARCVDGGQRPVAGAWISTELDRTTGEGGDERTVAHSGSDGELRFELGSGPLYAATRFVVGCEGFATRWLRIPVVVGETTHVGDLLFEPAGSVSGRVVDERGSPVAGAEVTVTPPGNLQRSADLELMRIRGPEIDIRAPGGRTGASGEFRVGGLPTGPARLWARASGTRWTLSPPVEVVAREELGGIELVLEAEKPSSKQFGPIEGIVLGPDGSPASHVEIGIHYSEGSSMSGTSTYGGADGRFRIDPIGRGPHELAFSDPKNRFAPMRLPEVQPGTSDLVVRLGEPIPIAVVVRSRGEPVTDFTVGWQEEGHTYFHEDRSNQPHTGGRVTLFAPAARFTVTVDAAGFHLLKLGPFDGRRPPEAIEFSLEQVPGVVGRVVAGGHPVAGARVWLHRYSRHMRARLNDFDLWVHPYEVCAATSDADGRFRLGLRQDGEYFLFAEAAGWAKGELGPLEVASATGLQGLEIELVAGGTIEGRVLTAAGRSPAGIVVGANHGEGKPRTQSVGPDGSFRFAGLTPGKWQVKRCRPDTGSNSTSVDEDESILGGSIETNCVVVDGETTRFDLDLGDDRPCLLDLELKVDGQPAAAWSAKLWSIEVGLTDSELPRAATDANGRARIRNEEPGEYVLVLIPPAEKATSITIRLPVELRRGTTPFGRDLKTGRVEGTIPDWKEGSELGWRYRSGSEADFEALVTIHPDPNGRFVLPIVPAGEGRIERDVAPSPSAVKFETVASFTVEAGKTSTVTVP